MASPTHPIGKLAKISNIVVSVDAKGEHAVVRLPGLGLDDINRVGRVGINRVLHWFTSSRIAAYHMPNKQTGKTFLEYDRMTSDRYTFMASSRTTVERSFYSLIDSAAGSFPCLDIKLHLGYVGTSSLNSVATLVEHERGTRLADNVNQVVTIDKVTRTPTPIPDWWKDTYQSAVVEDKRLIVAVRQVPADITTYKYIMKIAWSDTDQYKHTNYQSYVRFCLDAAMDALHNNFYTGLHGDILSYDIRSIESLYAGESRAGDSLVIETWQDPVQDLMLVFSVKREEKLVFQCTMEMHPPNVDI